MVRLPHALLLGGCAVAVAAGALAQISSFPIRRAGWWEATTTMNLPGAPPNMVTMNCIDAASERAVGGLSQSLGQRRDCSQQSITPIPGGYRAQATCTRSGRTSSINMIVTGDFNSHLHLDMTMNGAGPAATHMVIDEKYLGACPAGRRPGDVVGPNGMVFNMGGSSPN
jgi:hypothetical protein